MPGKEEEKKDQLILKPEDKVEKVPEKPVAVVEPPVLDDKGEIVKLIHTAGTLEFTKEQKKILFAPVNEEDVEIRPDGLIYLPWMEYVIRLRDAFDGKWAIVPVGKAKMENDLLLQEYWLLLDGRLYGKAIGEQQYYKDNYTMSWGDALEGCKSNGLMRLCKGIGIGLELWKPTFIRAWKKKYAEQYYDDRKAKYLWRKIDPEAKKEPPKKAAPPPPKPAPEKKKAPPSKSKKETKPEPEPEEEEASEAEMVTATVATDDQKDSIHSMLNTLVDAYERDPKDLERKMIAKVKERFKRVIKDVPGDCTEEEATVLMKCLNVTIKDEHKKADDLEEGI